jgi:hypothetical protein
MHIGCDEVFHLAVCARCSAKLRKAQAQQKDANIFSTDPRFNIFAGHVAKVARLVSAFSAIKFSCFQAKTRNFLNIKSINGNDTGLIFLQINKTEGIM